MKLKLYILKAKMRIQQILIILKKFGLKFSQNVENKGETTLEKKKILLS